MEVSNGTISQGLEKIKQLATQIFSHKASIQWNTGIREPFKIFTDFGNTVSQAAQTVWPLIEEAWKSFTSLNKNNLDPLYSIKNFLQSVFDPFILSKFFENLHLKIGNILSFSISGENRDSFLSLFASGKREGSLKAVKFLLGLPIEGNNNLRAKPNVFNYLLVKWMDNPDRVTAKFQRFSETIDRWNKNLTRSSSSGREGASDQGHVYELDIGTVEEYLNVPEGWSETLYEALWAGEIFTKIKTGHDLTFGSKSWISSLSQ